MMKIFKITFIIFCCFILFIQCKSREEIIKEATEIEKKYDKYKDSYVNFIYQNATVGVTINFDDSWIIRYKYEQFDDYEKKFAQYFSTPDSELLFIGINNKHKLNLKCTCEKASLNNEEYLSKLRSQTESEKMAYGLTLEPEKKVVLKSIEAITINYTVKITKYNSFIFNTIIFNSDKYNFKLDVWYKINNSGQENEYIQSIFDNINFVKSDLNNKTPSPMKKEQEH